MSIFEYPFMQRAFLVGILLALIIPCVGIVIVLKRLSMIGDALSHTSLAGVAAGLLFNINPVLGATAACVAAAFGIEAIRKKLPRYAEMSIAIILSAGVGLAGVLSGFVRSAASFNSFLFGSIVAISDGELYTVAVVSGIIVLAFLFLYKELFYLALDERAARMSGIPVCSATSFLRNWDSILEKKRANLRSISEPARLRQPPPQKHGSGTRKRAGSKHTGGATNSRPSRAFCPLVG